MTIIEIVASVFRIVLWWLKIQGEKNEALKKQKQEILQEANDALKAKDTSAITLVFDRLGRM